MIWTEADWNALAALVFRDDYPGNATARGVVEAPNGDPAQLDTRKRYAHVAWKYQVQLARGDAPDFPAVGQITLRILLERAWFQSCELAWKLRVPAAFHPSYGDGALRVLEYPAGVGASAVHTDFDLFTINLWRNVPNPGLPVGRVHMGELGELLRLGPATPHHVEPLPVVQRSLVYFAIPDHSAVLPGGVTVGQWIAERKSRSRVQMGDGQ